jgi:hypothetical protein
MVWSWSLIALSIAAIAVLQVRAVCDSQAIPLTLGADYYGIISCIGPGGENAMDSYPAQQSVQISATFHGGGYDVYDAFLTSGPSCSASPSDDSFSYEYGVSRMQTSVFTLPTTTCGPSAPCCLLVWCRNTVYDCILSVDYAVAAPSTPSPTPSRTPSRSPSQTLAPSPSVGSSPSFSNSISSTPSATPLPTTAPQYSRTTCNFTGTFDLPTTSSDNDFMFLSCSTPGGSLSQTAYASARLTNPNQCNISFVGSTACSIDPSAQSPALEAGLLWTSAPSLSFPSLNCGKVISGCCVMVWTDPLGPGGCEGLGLTWLVQRRAGQPAFPMPSRAPIPRPSRPSQGDGGSININGRVIGGAVAGVLGFLGLLAGACRQREGIKQCLGCSRLLSNKDLYVQEQQQAQQPHVMLNPISAKPGF